MTGFRYGCFLSLVHCSAAIRVFSFWKKIAVLKWVNFEDFILETIAECHCRRTFVSSRWSCMGSHFQTVWKKIGDRFQLFWMTHCQVFFPAVPQKRLLDLSNFERRTFYWNLNLPVLPTLAVFVVYAFQFAAFFAAHVCSFETIAFNSCACLHTWIKSRIQDWITKRTYF